MNKAFTMIELVFVIVVLSILAMVAVPRFGAMTVDATIAKGQADIATIRSAIVNERQTQLIQGIVTWIPGLSKTANPLFDGDNGPPVRNLLTYGIAAGDWAITGATLANAATESYTYTVGATSCTFDYFVASGRFDCNSTAPFGTLAERTLCTDLRD